MVVSISGAKKKQLFQIYVGNIRRKWFIIANVLRNSVGNNIITICCNALTGTVLLANNEHVSIETISFR